MTTLDISTLDDLTKAAQWLSKELKGGDIVVLEGNLGAGKTTFTKALAKELQIKSRVRSPSFTLLHEYKTSDKKAPIQYLVHADAYRIDSPEAWHDIGLTEWFSRKDAVTCIEWGEKLVSLLKGKKFWHLKFKLIKSGKRTLKIKKP